MNPIQLDLYSNIFSSKSNNDNQWIGLWCFAYLYSFFYIIFIFVEEALIIIKNQKK